MSVAIIVATADRPVLLGRTLDGLAACDLPDSGIRVVVADNGTDQDTPRMCRREYAGLDVVHLRVSRRGKTIAQNQAVRAVDADFLVFTDDDVEFDKDWLLELCRARDEWPEHRLFGGRVLPIWPMDDPGYLPDSRHVGPLYTHLDRGDEAGPLGSFRPFGPNMAVRRTVFDEGIRFDENIGPGSTGGVPMGDETELSRQLESRGETAVYVPSSRVYHRVRPAQLRLRWQLARSFRYGRMLAYFQRRTLAHRCLFGIPRWVYRRVATSLAAASWDQLRGHRRRAFDLLMDAAIAVGQGWEIRVQAVSSPGMGSGNDQRTHSLRDSRD